MDDFMYFVKVGVIFLGFIMAVLLVWAGIRALAGYGSDSAIQTAQHTFESPKTITHTFNLLPSQSTNLENRQFRKVEIRSEFPVQVLVGPCREAYTVDFFCDSAPADIFISDQRARPIFSSPQANPVTVTATEY